MIGVHSIVKKCIAKNGIFRSDIYPGTNPDFDSFESSISVKCTDGKIDVPRSILGPMLPELGQTISNLEKTEISFVEEDISRTTLILVIISFHKKFKNVTCLHFENEWSCKVCSELNNENNYQSYIWYFDDVIDLLLEIIRFTHCHAIKCVRKFLVDKALSDKTKISNNNFEMVNNADIEKLVTLYRASLPDMYFSPKIFLTINFNLTYKKIKEIDDYLIENHQNLNPDEYRLFVEIKQLMTFIKSISPSPSIWEMTGEKSDKFVRGTEQDASGNCYKLRYLEKKNFGTVYYTIRDEDDCFLDKPPSTLAICYKQNNYYHNWMKMERELQSIQDNPLLMVLEFDKDGEFRKVVAKNPVVYEDWN